MLKFLIDDNAAAARPEIEYVLKLWSKNNSIPISIVEGASDAVVIGTSTNATLRVSQKFIDSQSTSPGRFTLSEDDLQNDFLIETAFSLINSHQEFNADLDDLGRFKYSGSYQQKMGNVKDNIVQHLFDKLSMCVKTNVPQVPSKFFLSHDIDLVNSAIVEDGFNVVKRGRLDILLKMLFNIAIGRPDWLNMDRIMKIESAYDLRSTFFWIVNRGVINKRERNADYSFNSNTIQKQYRRVEQNGFENGIHKSLSKETFREEFNKYGSTPVANRYHYLKFNLPKAYNDIEEAELKLDASLGFAEEIGFRNSYGLPFNPFNAQTRSSYSFVEAPLHVMDRTYFQYKKTNPEVACTDILNFFEMNKTNCVLGVLWHNNFFTEHKFKGYLAVYKKILAYIKDNNFKTISAAEIVNHYSITP